MQRAAGRASKCVSLAFSLDGKCIASAGDDGVVRLWDVVTGRSLRWFAGHQAAVYQAAFSPDGRTLASAGTDGSVRLWGVASGSEVRTLRHDRPCVSVAFAPDGQALAWGDDAGGAHLASTATGRPLRHIATGDEHAVQHVYFSSDGGLLATHVETLCFWDTATGQRVDVLKNADASPGAVSPDGKTVALWGRDQTVHLWDLRSSREKTQPPGHRDGVLRAAFLGAGDRMVSVGEDDTLRLWETATGRLLHCRKGQESWELTVSPDGTHFATFGHDGRIRVWDSVTGRPFWRSSDLATFSALLAYRPDGRALVCADGLRVKWFHPASGAVLREFTMPCTIDPASTLLLSSCGRWMVAQEINSRRVQVFDAETGEWRPMPAGFETCIRALALSPDGRYLIVARKDEQGERESVLLWEMSAGVIHRLMVTRVQHCFGAAFNSDGKTLATATRDGRVRLWSTVTGEEVGDLGDRDAENLAFSPDGGLLATWGRDTTILVWDVAALTHRNDLARLPRASVADAWGRLGGQADVAHTAVWQMTADPEQSVPFLAERLRPAIAPDRQKVTRWIAELDSDDYSTRERAAAELEKCAGVIRETLRASLRAAPSAEAKRRLKHLLETARQADLPSGEVLRPCGRSRSWNTSVRPRPGACWKNSRRGQAPPGSLRTHGPPWPA